MCKKYIISNKNNAADIRNESVKIIKVILVSEKCKVTEKHCNCLKKCQLNQSWYTKLGGDNNKITGGVQNISLKMKALQEMCVTCHFKLKQCNCCPKYVRMQLI